MKNYNLNIAGYNIGFYSTDDGPDLAPSARFLRNISHNTESDVQICIHSGSFNLPGDAERVFHAPFVEEIYGIQIHNKPNFWSVWKYRSDLYIMIIFPNSDPVKNAFLKFSFSDKNWDLWIDSDEKEIDPFEYPLDGLILYYLTVINGDIMIHASGVNNAGRGYLFSGVSGKGKSTLALLWDNYGAKVIHDDRLIIRKTGDVYMMYNTPVYNNEDPYSSPLNKIFILDHSVENKLIPLKGATAVSMVMANCIQHTWESFIISKLLESVSDMCIAIPTFRLFFRPDSTVIDHILKNEA